MPRQILIFLDDAYEDLEIMYPKYRLIEAGFGVPRTIQSKEKKDHYPVHINDRCGQPEIRKIAGHKQTASHTKIEIQYPRRLEHNKVAEEENTFELRPCHLLPTFSESIIFSYCTSALSNVKCSSKYLRALIFIFCNNRRSPFNSFNFSTNRSISS